MTTRWFVEVSPVDADALKERYCIEALQWQQALQHARKLRGDRGALARFAIELLESGYRATDPSTRLRYVVSRAPRGESVPESRAPARAISERPGPMAPSSRAPVPLEPPPPIPVAAAPVPLEPPPPIPVAAAPAVESVLPEAVPEQNRAEPITEPEPLSFPKAAPAPKPEAIPSLPGMDLISLRKEEPTEATPITYREFAFVVAAGLTARDLERYARATWEQVRAAIADRTSRKFVQIALFDHHFAGRPDRPPVAVLSWKDWRGDPVVQLRTPSGQAPQPQSQTVPAEPAPSLRTVAEPPAPSLRTVAEHAAAESSASSLRAIAEHALAEPPASSLRAIAEQALAEPPAPSLRAIAEHARAEPPPAPSARAHAAPSLGFPVSAAPVSAAPTPAAPRALPAEVSPRRRGPSEDLIGELFDEMHQLRFMPDIVAGAEYVLDVLARVVPSQGILIHVFDINTRLFVVVRAFGPASRSVLLRKTPDTFPPFREAFRRARALHLPQVTPEDGYESGRWEVLGVEVRTALCGPVKEGGRYLGIVELANPMGGTPFHDAEVNAVDYICEQFADFVASRPIVLDEDAVIPRT